MQNILTLRSNLLLVFLYGLAMIILCLSGPKISWILIAAALAMGALSGGLEGQAILKAKESVNYPDSTRDYPFDVVPSATDDIPDTLRTSAMYRVSTALHILAIAAIVVSYGVRYLFDTHLELGDALIVFLFAYVGGRLPGTILLRNAARPRRA